VLTTIRNKGVVCILFKDQKYRFIREIISGQWYYVIGVLSHIGANRMGALGAFFLYKIAINRFIQLIFI